jgi:Zn-dependent oligopeptidase
MTSFRDMYVQNGVEQRPFVSLVCNFTKPTENTPSLLTHYEFTTLLHEFGHALHGMFAQGTYPSLTGTNVSRDFVELPSQIMENWAVKKEFLASFAKHYQTGEAIPDELIEKIVAAKNYLSGYMNVEARVLKNLETHYFTNGQEIDKSVLTEVLQKTNSSKTQDLENEVIVNDFKLASIKQIQINQINYVIR